MRVSTLICHRDVPMALRCLDSVARSVGDAQLVLHDDGSLTADDVDRLKDALPVVAIVPRTEADQAMREALRRHPACARARETNVLMLKLFDVALLSEGDIRYCDTDVLFLRRSRGLLDFRLGDPAAIFMHDANHAYSARPWHLLGGEALRLPRFLNSGLFLMRRQAYDLDYLERLLARETIRRIFGHVRVWAEQTCWAALAFRAGCGLWDPSRIAVVGPGWTPESSTVAAHFVSSYRHRLADFAPSALAPDDPPVAVPVLPARECSALELARSQFARRLRRACGF